jgi:hypothetical protein
MKAFRALSGMLVACALGAGVAACGSSTSTSSAPRTSAPKTTAPPTSLPGLPPSQHAVVEIKANWAAFFSARTPVSRRIRLLQDGQQFASIIKSQASSGLAARASAVATKVTLVSATQAIVIYPIMESGKPVLSNQTGVAVLQNGIWKVGVASFCSLLALENGGKTASLPAACRAASPAPT